MKKTDLCILSYGLMLFSLSSFILEKFFFSFILFILSVCLIVFISLSAKKKNTNIINDIILIFLTLIVIIADGKTIVSFYLFFFLLIYNILFLNSTCQISQNDFRYYRILLTSLLSFLLICIITASLITKNAGNIKSYISIAIILIIPWLILSINNKKSMQS